jgi:AcrR family transcriptional regulator
VNRINLSERAGVSPALVTYYYKTANNLRDAIMRAAVRREDLTVIAQGLLLKHPEALKADIHLRRKAAAIVAA